MRAYEFITEEELDEDWRKWVAGGAMAASALAPMAAQAQSYQAPPADATAVMQTMRKDDARAQQYAQQQALVKVIYAQMVKQRGQPMDARQQQKWMTIAQDKAAAQIQQQQANQQQTQQQQGQQQQSQIQWKNQEKQQSNTGNPNFVNRSEYKRNPMLDKDW